MIEAIVYTSNTGYAAEYAKMLGEKTGLPVYSYAQAKRELLRGIEIIYFGWLMAGRIMGYRSALKRFEIPMPCGVGIGDTYKQIPKVRKANGMNPVEPVFLLQGGFDRTKLHGIYKLIMAVLSPILISDLSNRPKRGEEEEAMLDMLRHGGSRVCDQNLAVIFEWYRMDLES